MSEKRKNGHAAAEVELLTPKEAAALLKISESFLAKARMRGDGPRYRKLSRSVRYEKTDVVLWLKTRTKTSTAERDPIELFDTSRTDERSSGKEEEWQ
jgi:hypothetical protein